MSEKKPFRLGDVCKYVGSDSAWHTDDKYGHIVDTCRMIGPEAFEYATSAGGWIHHVELELVEESSVSSRAKLHQMKEEDRESLEE